MTESETAQHLSTGIAESDSEHTTLEGHACIGRHRQRVFLLTVAAKASVEACDDDRNDQEGQHDYIRPKHRTHWLRVLRLSDCAARDRRRALLCRIVTPVSL